MDICIITNDTVLARFFSLELEEIGYTVCVKENYTEARLAICDLDFTSDIPQNSIGFSYDEKKRSLVKNFLLRPIDASKLRSAVSKLLAEPTSSAVTSIEVDILTRKVKTERGEVRLSEKELALFK